LRTINVNRDAHMNVQNRNVSHDSNEGFVEGQFVLPVLFISVSLLAHAQIPAASLQNAQRDPVQSYLQPLANNHTMAGAVTLVADQDRILYLKAAGFRDLSAKAPMQTDDMFWIASTSKPMTATALMMLVDGPGGWTVGTTEGDAIASRLCQPADEMVAQSAKASASSTASPSH
jgi:Beta-lactamase